MIVRAAVTRPSPIIPAGTGTARSVRLKRANAGSPREKRLLGVPYFHVVFTLPHELIPLCQRNPQDPLRSSVSAPARQRCWRSRQTRNISAPRSVSQHPAHLGTKPAAASPCALRHPGRRLPPTILAGCIPKYAFFLPVKVLSRVFRGKFVDGLQRAFRRKKIPSLVPTPHSNSRKQFRRFLRTLRREDWVVYAKPALGGARRCCAISAGTHTASPSATIVCSRSTESGLHSAGKIMHAAISSGK